MENIKLENVKVYSPVVDNEIRNTLSNSPIWKKAYHPDELATAKINHTELYEYDFKFAGLKVVQSTGVKKLKK
jgi:hypothetical protein